jgi:2-methylisocitrate lyase-like PEP mutase family enzyme
MTSQNDAAAFRRLHAPGAFLILPNAWDAGSARLIESLGAPAIATSSAALAWANGYPDGDALPISVLARTIEAIARVIDVPLSVDSEGGYSHDPAIVEENFFAIASAGAVGINLEDGTGTPDLHCSKIEAAKRGARRAGVDLFVNARVDVVLRQLVPREQAIDETIARAMRYKEAGCDGIFVPRLVDAEDIRGVAKAIDPLPLNVMAVPQLAPAAELRVLGARRLSAGAAIARAALHVTRRLATVFLRDGKSEDVFAEIREMTDFNALFPR